MGRVLVPTALAIAALVACAGHRGASRSASPPIDPPLDVFRAQIAPLLAQRCAPCHNPGGKMYESMPFDDPATITGHAEGVLKRIKTPDEHALIEQWLASRPKS